MTMKIYIITHKNFNERYDANVYYPLLVGANKNSCDIAKVKDNTGDNISNENPYFCELTGLYWIWKTCQKILLAYAIIEGSLLKIDTFSVIDLYWKKKI